MEDTDELPVVPFTQAFMATLNREVGRAVSIDPADMEPRDDSYCCTFYILDPAYKVFEVSVWENLDLDTQRDVLAAALDDPARVALEPEVLAAYEAELIDRAVFKDKHYHGIVFGSLMYLTEWAHVFGVEDAVTIVGTPALTGRVSVNFECRCG